MAISRQQLAALDKEELQEVIKTANNILEGRKDQRKKELWGNVIAAIAKYEREIGDIRVHCYHCQEEYMIDKIDGPIPGYIFIS